MSDKVVWASEEHHARANELASAMFELTGAALSTGLPLPDLFSALAILCGLMLAGPYETTAKRKRTMEAVTKSALQYAEQAAILYERRPIEVGSRA